MNPNLQEYDVTVSRMGCVKIKAESPEAAKKAAEALPPDSITWFDLTATDVEGLDRQEVET